MTALIVGRPPAFRPSPTQNADLLSAMVQNWPYNDTNAAQHRQHRHFVATADAGLMPRHSASVERQPLAQRDDATNRDTEKNNIPSIYCRLAQNVLNRSAKSPTEPLP